MTIHVYTMGRGHYAVVRQRGRQVWRSRTVPYGHGGLAWALAQGWIRGAR